MKCKKGEKYRIYDKASIPKRLHYANNSRIGDLVVDGVLGAEIFV